MLPNVKLLIEKLEIAYFLETEVSIIEEFFKKITNRSDVGILLINQHVRTKKLFRNFFDQLILFYWQVANDIRHLIRDYNKVVPTILEIPSKDQPYDPSQDFIMQRVNMVLGNQG